MPTSDGKIRVLAIAGGGIRGIIPAYVLREIEAKTGKKISELVDMVCGTSTGGILTSALTKPSPLTANQTLNLYLNRGREIFNRSWWQKVRNLGKTVGPKYDGKGLTRVLSETFGDQILENATVPTFLTAYAIEKREPIFFKSWVPSGANRLLRDVCLATSAGPTYFPPANVNGDWYWDGGVINNNPSLSGVIEACMKYQVHTRDCLVLSLGTGVNEGPIDHKKALGWGDLGVVGPLLDVCMDGVSELTHYQMCDLMPDQNYLALQTALLDENASMDSTEPQNLGVLIAKAQELVDSNSGRLADFCDRLKG
ncbi:MAG: patatin [Cytophagaceae bacterium]|nr:MAG: patatin [Cytophagaceae bacterium]